ncbi:MAG: nitroreductase family protein [Comamonadaceae bacterium]|nr:nitroreductase family protein [Comamonadaceae bacterium]
MPDAGAARDASSSILAVAARAPSGTNTQPWKVTVLTGAAQGAAVGAHPRRLRRPGRARERTPRSTPTTRPSGSRPTSTAGARSAGTCTACSASAKADKARMHAQHGRNYAFFDAPVGLIFTHRPRDAPGQLAGLRHVPAEHHGGRARARRWTPARRRRSRSSTASSRDELACPTPRWSSAACRSARPTRPRRRTPLVTEREPVSAFARFLD